MTYAKCVVVGLVAGVAAAFIWNVAKLIIPIARMVLSGGLVAESFGSGADVILPGTAGFVIGFALMLRRQKRIGRSR